jgi:hypothetical protein
VKYWKGTGPRASPGVASGGVIYAERVLTELVTRPIKAAVALVELPLTAKRSLDEVNALMEVSRRQLEAMQRQTDSALDQAERMNELLSRVVKLTEPIEKAQRGGEYFADGLRRMIFGDEPVPAPPVVDATAIDADERAAIDADERVAIDADERAAIEADAETGPEGELPAPDPRPESPEPNKPGPDPL